VFKTKPELALGMLKRAVKQRLPRGVVLADAGYGSSVAFRDGVRKLKLDYAVGVDPKTTVWCVEGRSSLSAEKLSVRDLATKLEAEGGFRHYTWREGTNDDLSARFLVRRVVPAFEDASRPPDEREQLWLVVEWRDGELEPANYFLSSMAVRTSHKKLIGTLMQRWRTERAYQDLKGELGLDHFEGRSFPGWHHHISVVLCCYAFVVAERVRRFPPSAPWSDQDDKDTVAARAPLRGQLRHRQARNRTPARQVAAPLSRLSSARTPTSRFHCAPKSRDAVEDMRLWRTTGHENAAVSGALRKVARARLWQASSVTA
jgi:hypothetical protein